MKKIPHCKTCDQDGHYSVGCRNYPVIPVSSKVKQKPSSLTSKPKKLSRAKLKKQPIYATTNPCYNGIMYYLEPKPKICPICNKEFTTRDVRIKYCSLGCSKQGRVDNINERRKKYEINNILKFGISSQTNTNMTFRCKNCKKKFTRPRSQVSKRGVSYCSLECKSDFISHQKPKDKILIDGWSKAVKLYDGQKCVYCGKTTYLNSHHIFSRSNMSTRYEIANGITLCSGCHTLSSKFSAHKTPVEFVEWIKELRGDDWYQKLRTQARQSKKYTIDELRLLRDNFKDIISHFSDDEKC